MNERPHLTERLERLAWELCQTDLDAYICSSPITLGYQLGFFEDGLERFLVFIVNREGRTCMICPSLTKTQARRCGVREIITWRDGEDPMILFRRLLNDWGLESGKLAVDSDMAASQLLEMQKALPRVTFSSGQPIMSRLMSTKTETEIELLLKAGKIADDTFQIALPRIQPGMTELNVAGILREAMFQLGGMPTFSIVAAGSNGAEPHHLPNGTKINKGDALILDFGCNFSGYQSDITRTVFLGRAHRELKDIYNIVFQAQLAGRAAIRPGVPCQDIDRSTRKVITDAGYGPNFLHRTGHGIGMRGHEDPYIVEGNALPLASGHCISIEPGIYLAERFGVRIENCVVCTPDGHLSLNAEPSSEIIEICN